jgi:Methyltransferase domain
MNYLNLGCGSRFHSDWVNLDLQPIDSRVRSWDLRKELPFSAESFDVVYHSHFLEHLPRHAGAGFLRECYRVLKPGGVIRVVVPDLEQIARRYLGALERGSRDEPGWSANYDWMVLEMYDQTVREKSCGAFAEYFSQNPIPNWDFVFERLGSEANLLRESFQTKPVVPLGGQLASNTAWQYALRNPGKVLRGKLARLLLGEQDWRALQIGLFRRAGEVHLWMYDSYSLRRLLRQVGFVRPIRVGATESQIPDWPGFCLDSEPDGRTYKPDSLFMEASHP